MSDPSQSFKQQLQQYRDYLLAQARQKMIGFPRNKFDSSDLVQQTLLQAHENFAQFRGRSDGELRAWLRKILENNLGNAIEALGAQKRDVTREQSLDAALDDAIHLHRLAAEQSTPSEQAARNERELRLTESLGRLTDHERTAVKLRHLDGCSVKEISRLMGRSEAAVAGLLRRGLEKLRELVDESS